MPRLNVNQDKETIAQVKGQVDRAMRDVHVALRKFREALAPERTSFNMNEELQSLMDKMKNFFAKKSLLDWLNANTRIEETLKIPTGLNKAMDTPELVISDVHLSVQTLIDLSTKKNVRQLIELTHIVKNWVQGLNKVEAKVRRTNEYVGLVSADDEDAWDHENEVVESQEMTKIRIIDPLGLGPILKELNEVLTKLSQKETVDAALNKANHSPSSESQKKFWRIFTAVKNDTEIAPEDQDPEMDESKCITATLDTISEDVVLITNLIEQSLGKVSCSGTNGMLFGVCGESANPTKLIEKITKVQEMALDIFHNFTVLFKIADEVAKSKCVFWKGNPFTSDKDLFTLSSIISLGFKNEATGKTSKDKRVFNFLLELREAYETRVRLHHEMIATIQRNTALKIDVLIDKMAASGKSSPELFDNIRADQQASLTKSIAQLESTMPTGAAEFTNKLNKVLDAMREMHETVRPMMNTRIEIQYPKPIR